MHLIQIAGLGRAGKSVLSAYICEHALTLGYTPVILPFARALKEEATALGFDKLVNPVGYREYCQVNGAAKRKENPDHWVELTSATIRSYLKKERTSQQNKDVVPAKYLIVQDDLRYMNEIGLGMELNSFRIFLSAGAREIQEPGADWRAHESELLNYHLNEQVLTGPTIRSHMYLRPNVDTLHADVSELFSMILLNDKQPTKLQAVVTKHLETWLQMTPMIDARVLYNKMSINKKGIE